MSHLVTIQTRMRDPTVLQAACRRLGLEPPVQGTLTATDGQTTEGLLVKLPGWRLPVAVRADGTVAQESWNRGRLQSYGWEFSQFEGRSYGDEAQLKRLIQAYAVEAVRAQARRRGHTVTESVLPDGSIRLVLMEA